MTTWFPDSFHDGGDILAPPISISDQSLLSIRTSYYHDARPLLLRSGFQLWRTFIYHRGKDVAIVETTLADFAFDIDVAS
jgi:hypothetical protein